MLSQDSVDSSERGSSLVMDNDDTSSVKSFSSVSDQPSPLAPVVRVINLFTVDWTSAGHLKDVPR